MIDYFASHLWQLWALVSFICLILELTNGDFFIMCFAIGGVCAAIASALGVGFYGGLLVFAICSVLSLWLVRPTALKYLHKNADERARPSRLRDTDEWPSTVTTGKPFRLMAAALRKEPT